MVSYARATNAKKTRKEMHCAKRLVPLDRLHRRLGHKSSKALLITGQSNVWADVLVDFTSDPDCVDCHIATIRAEDRTKHPRTPSQRFGQLVFMDIQQAIAGGALTPDSYYPYSLFLVDAFSRLCQIYGLQTKSSEDVIQAIKKFTADHGLVNEFGYGDVDKFKSDAGSQFTSPEFRDFCHETGINLSLAAPKRLSQNHLAERTWQTVTSMARLMLVHARLPDTFHYFAIRYATNVFNYYQ